MKRSSFSQDDEATLGWIMFRSAIAVGVGVLIVVGAVIAAVGGSHNNMNAGVVFGIGLALLPAGIYCFGVRTRSSIVLAGVVLLVVSGVAWGMFLIGHSTSAFSGVYIIPAFFITLVSSTVAATRDQAR